MSSLPQRATSSAGGVVHAVASSLSKVIAAAGTLRARRADSRAHAICPVDDWAFTPLYTDGTCPLCGWNPPGYTHRAPALSRLDWYWAAMLGIVAVSAIMLIAVLSAYLGT